MTNEQLEQWGVSISKSLLIKSRFGFTFGGDYTERNDQVCRGDWWFTCNGKKYSVEAKAERKHTGNLFWETDSNRKIERAGWGYNLIECNFLSYAFLDKKICYVAKFKPLKAFIEATMKNYCERRQWKNKQLNDTYARLVPIELLEKNKLIEACNV